MTLTPTIKKMLSKLTPEQIVDALEHAQKPVVVKSSTKNVPSSKGKKNSVGPVSVTKATRPLNSWIAYRTYYSKIFIKIQQKQISSFLTCLWSADPYKAKWSILAKAYSVIRDRQGKENAPLDQFLAINGTFMGIIDPANYLQALGWQVAINGEGQTFLHRDDILLDESLSMTNLSVNDVICFSYSQGYVVGNLSDFVSTGNEIIMTMASSVQSVSNRQLTDASIENGANSGTMGETQVSSEVGKDSVGVGESGMEVGPSNVANSDNGGNASAAHRQGVLTTYQPSASELTSSNFALRSAYPHNSEFDPDAPTDLLFDPFNGDQFDVFEMSDIDEGMNNGEEWKNYFNFDGAI